MNTRLKVLGPVCVNPTAGLLYALTTQLYMVMGKYALFLTEEGKRHPDYPHAENQDAALWMKTRHDLLSLLNDAARPMRWSEWTFICDETTTTPDLVDEGKLGLLMMVKPQREPEFYSDYFALGFERDEQGVGSVTIEYRRNA